jgi:hypothetical protein
MGSAKCLFFLLRPLAFFLFIATVDPVLVSTLSVNCKLIKNIKIKICFKIETNLLVSHNNDQTFNSR